MTGGSIKDNDFTDLLKWPYGESVSPSIILIHSVLFLQEKAPESWETGAKRLN
jgi:hypothetical protein